MIQKGEVTAEQVAKAIEKGFKENIRPAWNQWKKEQLELWKKRHPGHIIFT